MTTGDRMGRAEDYVLGLMTETERVRAERDMALDPEFRDCVLELARKLQRLHDTRRPEKSADEAWNEIAERIAELPQMAGVARAPQQEGGRQQARPAKPRVVRRRPVGHGLHETGGGRGLVLVLGIAAVFAIGYLVGYLR